MVAARPDAGHRRRRVAGGAGTVLLFTALALSADPPGQAQHAEAETRRVLVVRLARLAGAQGPLDIIVRGGSGASARLSVPEGAGEAELRVGEDETAVSCTGASVWCPDTAIPRPAPATLSLPVYPRAVLHGTWSALGRDRSEIAVLGVVRTPRPDASEAPLRFTRSVPLGADGRFSFDGPRGRLDLQFSAAGCAPVYRFDVVARDVLSLGRFVCVPGGSVAGRVRDASSGLVAPGCTLTLRQLARVAARATPAQQEQDALVTARTVSDDSGFFQFRGLAPGRYWLQAETSRHAPAGREVDVQTDTEAYLDDVWLLPYRAVAVSVLPPRPPTGGRWVAALRGRSAGLRQDVEEWVRVQVDDDGTAEFPRVAPGEHQVEIRTDAGEVVYAGLHVVPEAPEVLTIALDIVTLEGRVRRGGAPVGGVKVILSTGGVDERTFVTDEEGRFEGWMQRPSDAVFVDVAAAAWTVRSMVVRPEVVGADRLRIEVTLGTSSLRVHVADQEGAPISGATVHIAGEGTRAPVTGTTGEHGVLEVDGLDPGRYHVSAVSREHGTSDRVQIELASEATLDVALVLAEHRDLPFQLTSFEGSPVSGADVSILTPDSFDRHRTDAAGRAVFRVTRRSAFGVVQVAARSHMLWSGCRRLPADGPLVVRLPHALTGTIKIEAGTAPGMGLALVTEEGGLLNRNTLAAWRAALGYATPELGLETPGVAVGFYRLLWWPSHDQFGLVTLACSGSLPPDATGGLLKPGETLVLVARPPQR